MEYYIVLYAKRYTKNVIRIYFKTFKNRNTFVSRKINQANKIHQEKLHK